MFRMDAFSDVLLVEIKRQMQEQMSKDESVNYWLNDSFIGEEFASVDANRNFYWNADGNLVIVFDKYEVGPGSMGTPEFVIEKSVIEGILKPEYRDIIQ